MFMFFHIESVKRNAERQVDLLCRAVDLLRDNGKASLIYSTCALSDIENDGVSVMTDNITFLLTSGMSFSCTGDSTFTEKIEI